MSELGELKRAVLNVQPWANEQVSMFERRWKAAAAGHPARHRALLRRLKQELEVSIPSQFSDREAERLRELRLRDRVAALIEAVGTPRWKLKEQIKIIRQCMLHERIQVNWAAMDIRSWYGGMRHKSLLLKEAYERARALQFLWTTALSGIEELEQEDPNDAAAIASLLSGITSWLATQKKLVAAFAEVRDTIHKIDMREYEERAKARAADLALYEEDVEIRVRSLVSAMTISAMPQ